MSEKDEKFTDEFKSGLSDLGDKVSTLRDRVKLKLHLGSMEAKKAFENLEPALDRIKNDLKSAATDIEAAADEAEVKAHLAFMEARDRWNHVRGNVDDVVHDVKSKSDSKLKGTFDEARLQSHLAAMDADDAVKERTTRARQTLEGAQETVKKETKAAIADIRKTFDDLIKILD